MQNTIPLDVLRAAELVHRHSDITWRIIRESDYDMDVATPKVLAAFTAEEHAAGQAAVLLVAAYENGGSALKS